MREGVASTWLARHWVAGEGALASWEGRGGGGRWREVTSGLNAVPDFACLASPPHAASRRVQGRVSGRVGRHGQRRHRQRQRQALPRALAAGRQRCGPNNTVPARRSNQAPALRLTLRSNPLAPAQTQGPVGRRAPRVTSRSARVPPLVALQAAPRPLQARGDGGPRHGPGALPRLPPGEFGLAWEMPGSPTHACCRGVRPRAPSPPPSCPRADLLAPPAGPRRRAGAGRRRRVAAGPRRALLWLPQPPGRLHLRAGVFSCGVWSCISVKPEPSYRACQMSRDAKANEPPRLTRGQAAGTPGARRRQASSRHLLPSLNLATSQTRCSSPRSWRPTSRAAR